MNLCNFYLKHDTFYILQNIKMGKDYLGADQRKTTDKKDTEEKEIKVQIVVLVRY